jgi:hypothetical protein
MSLPQISNPEWQGLFLSKPDSALAIVEDGIMEAGVANPEFASLSLSARAASFGSADHAQFIHVSLSSSIKQSKGLDDAIEGIHSFKMHTARNISASLLRLLVKLFDQFHEHWPVRWRCLSCKSASLQRGLGQHRRSPALWTKQGQIKVPRMFFGSTVR